MELPKWHLEMDLFKAFKTTFIVEGNVYDLQPYPTKIEESTRWDMVMLDNYLHSYLKESGYENIVFYNNIDGFSNEFDNDALKSFLEISCQGANNNSIRQTSDSCYNATLERATDMIREALGNRKKPSAIIMNLASRYVSSPDNLSDEEREVYSKLLLTSLKRTQVKVNDGLVNNLLFIIANKINDIPTWFYIDNPHVKTLMIQKPDKSVRKNFIDTQIKFFTDVESLTPDELYKSKEKFVNLTDGFKNIELNGLKTLCRQENIPFNKISEAITLFKYGIKKNPWDSISDEKLREIEQSIKKRVKGQESGITQTIDIVKRAVSGMSGLQHSSSSSKPKGILFFAGPTGTGKTELAKTLAEWLFGTESACIRFDMSEYQQSHSDQKLLGAPPGYVGYESGGQLTNAVKEKPFSILLFDEIEKAHPSIFDKFLQILEDGRMTDGKGETVYFSDCIIIFTSNLGIYTKDEYGRRLPNVNIEMEYEEMKQRVLGAIKDYFVLELGRPELLNRIGNNFVIFDFIREETAKLIVDSQIKKISTSLLNERNIKVVISENAKEFLEKKAMSNLENGGRGIGNVIEKYFVNSLSRYIFDNKVQENCILEVIEIIEDKDIAELICEVKNV
ncbi:MAG: AAA family ATPase [Tissierellales bacterium]